MKLWSYSDSAIEWCDGSGRLTLALFPDEAAQGYHSGACDDDIAELRRSANVADQLAALNPAHVRETLREYGAWDADELADHDSNLSRILWIACGDIIDRT